MRDDKNQKICKSELMNSFYKILLFSILSFSLPIGKLFEIFSWNDRIIKTETVFRIKRFETKRKSCLFIKIAKKIEKNLSIRFQDRHDILIREKIKTLENKQLEFTQNKKINKFKIQLIRRFIFNILYLDDSEYLMVSYF